jgi:hypothetical protein
LITTSELLLTASIQWATLSSENCKPEPTVLLLSSAVGTTVGECFLLQQHAHFLEEAGRDLLGEEDSDCSSNGLWCMARLHFAAR